MLAQTTRTAGVSGGRGAGELEASERSAPWVTQPLVPEVSGDRASERESRTRRGSTGDEVQIAFRITAENHHPGAEVLDRKTKLVKLY